jgi:hypothetical protein
MEELGEPMMLEEGIIANTVAGSLGSFREPSVEKEEIQDASIENDRRKGFNSPCVRV